MTAPPNHPSTESTSLAAGLARAAWRLGDRLMDALAVSACAACDARLAERAVFCPPCAAAVLPATTRRSGSLRVIAYGAYGGPIAEAIQRLKYRRRPDLARPLGELLRAAVHASPPAVDRIVPVPLHPVRLGERQFNQAALLAARLRADLDADLDTSSLERCRNTPPQAGLDARQRAANLRGAFRIRRPERIAGRRIALVDDVITTGATVNACALELRRAGAAAVIALAVACVD